jgi:phage terminase small subunit
MMNPRKEKFVEAYVRLGNATEAAKAAGYSLKTAYSQGHRLLKDADISAALAASRQQVMADLRLEAKDVLQELVYVARSDVGNLFTADGALKKLSEMDEGARRSIAGIDVEAETENHGKVTKVRLWSKTEALDKLAKHLGLYEKDNAQKALTLADLVPRAAAAAKGK